jgi:hypothetical protein
MFRKAILVCVLIMASAACLRSQETGDFSKWIEEAEKLLETVDDYTTVFRRQVRVGGS